MVFYAPWARRALLAALLATPLTEIARAQQAPQPKEEAPLVVEGVVREVFRSPRESQVDYLLQIAVTRSEAGRTPREPVRLVLPAPGEAFYVHVLQKNPDAVNAPATGGHRAIPEERSIIRAYLYPRAQGGWQGACPDWYELTVRELAQRTTADPEPAAEDRAPTTAPANSGLAALGVRFDRLQLGDQVVFRAAEVQPGSPAEQAGLKPGGFIIQANGKSANTIEELDALVRQSGDVLNLTVLDLRTGQPGAIKVDLSRRGSATTRATEMRRPEVPVGPAAVRSLGATTESVTAGRIRAVRVVQLAEGGAAQKAGIEVGDVIIEAGGKPATTPEQLQEAVGKSGPTLALVVVDPNKGIKANVEVALGGAERPEAPPRPLPEPTPPSTTPGSNTNLGLSVEFDVIKGTAGLKVVQVQPNSPAAMAGLEPGDVIVSANETVPLSGEQLDGIVKKSGPVIKLLVFDPKSGKKTPIDVKLGSGR